MRTIGPGFRQLTYIFTENPKTKYRRHRAFAQLPKRIAPHPLSQHHNKTRTIESRLPISDREKRQGGGSKAYISLDTHSKQRREPQDTGGAKRWR